MNDTSGNGSSGDGAAGGKGPAGDRPGAEFLVVGIGASAGGIKALKEFFARVPAESRMAYVVILHLSPNHESQLAEVLQQAAAIPVTQVRESVRVEPDHVYVIPPNQSLSITDGRLALSDVTRFEERRAPVDIFFRTLAQSHDSRAVSVVLSGTGADGSMGMKRVKEMGGVCLAQDPKEAEYEDMPRHSIATGLVDYVLPAAEMPARIMAYRDHLAQVRIPAGTSDAREPDGASLRDIFTLLRKRTGHDFSSYKRATVLRRIERRMIVHQLAELPAYARLLREDAGETGALLKDLLISVTNFFRDREAFEALEQKIVPRLFDGKGAGDHVRVWVAGCATGEEAYSVAMQLAEYAEGMASPPVVQVFATDIDERAVAAARDGFYTPNDAADVSPERLRRFFVQGRGGYQVCRELREVVLFAHHNVIKDPPFSHLDLVTCRNLLIYLNRAAQERLMGVFHFALNPGGFLFLGSSESVGGPSNLFLTADKEHHIFEARAVESGLRHVSGPFFAPARTHERLLKPRETPQSRAAERLSYADIHMRLVEQYGPPSVVVNEEYDILHMSEHAGRYLRVTGGLPSHNLLKLVRPELRLELRTALHQAVQRLTNVEARDVKVTVDGEAETLNLLIRPVLRADDAARGFILVVFDKSPGPGAGAAEAPAAAEPLGAGEPVARRIEEELERAKGQLLATVEQYEVQTEELKAANEELQAANEELLSTAEEMETGKEELQSVNEELTTVNQELKIKVEELSQSNDDFQNLMGATEIGTVFLDRALSIKMFTPPACDIFNLIPADIGRPLSDITTRIAHGELLDFVEEAARTLQTVESEVRTDEGRWFLLRVLPYRTAQDLISGIVLTFLDITARKRAEAHLRRSEEPMRLLVESATDYSVIFQDPDGRIEIWNKGAERMFGWTEAEAVGRRIDMIFTPEDRAAGRPAEEMRQAREQGRAPDERWHLRKDGSRFYVSGVMTPLREGGEVVGYTKIARDLTERQQMEEELLRTRDELEVRVRERTRELAETNESLRREVAERTRSEQERVGLLRQLVRTQEDERRRIAREIHDHLGQQSTALRLNLETLKLRCANYGELCEQIDQTQAIAARLDADVDFLAWELRPAALDDLGLAAALTNFGQEWSKHFNIPLEFHTAGLDAERLPPETETCLYRIAQEALNNVCKHARAGRVGMILERRDHTAVLIVEDDGVGFDDADLAGRSGIDKGLGLIGMRERAAIVGGTLDIESTPGVGTTIYARVPDAPLRGGAS